MRVAARLCVWAMLIGVAVWSVSAGLAFAQSTTTTYEYDPVGRVVSAIDSTGRAVVYKYDAAGNRVRVGNESNFAEFSPSSFQASSTSGTTGLTSSGMRDQNYAAASSIHITQSEAAPWIRANFGGPLYINHVCIAPAANGVIGPANSNGSVLEYSSDSGATWRTAASVNSLVASVCGPVVVRASVNAVRLRRSTSGQLAVGDFRFFSSPSDNFTVPNVSDKSLAVTSGGWNTVDLTPTSGGPWTAIEILSGPSAAKGQVTKDGAIVTYTAVAGFTSTQTDTLTYRAQGPAGYSGTANVAVTISPAVAPPTVSNRALTVKSGTSNSVDLAPGGQWTNIEILTGPDSTKGSISRTGSILTYSALGGVQVNKSDLITFRAIGPGGASPTNATLTVTITPPDPPVVDNKSMTVTSGSYADVDLLPQGQWNTVTIMTQPSASKGYIERIGATVVRYHASGGVVSQTQDQFTYRAVGDGGASLDRTVTVTILAQPVPPYVNDQSMGIGSGSSVTLDLTPNGGPWTSVDVVTGPSKGQVAKLDASHFRYTANGGIVSATTDSFTYRAQGPYGPSNLGTVRFDIAAAANPPVANPVGGTVQSGQEIRIAVNVTGGSWNQLVWDTLATKGTASFDNLYIVYRANPNITSIQTDVFSYKATGTNGTSNPANVTVNITPAPSVTASVSDTAYSRQRDPTGWQASQPNAIGCNVQNGSGSYTYEWFFDGGTDTLAFPTSASSVSTGWSSTRPLNADGTYVSTWRCRIYDTVKQLYATSNPVTVTIEYVTFD